MDTTTRSVIPACRDRELQRAGERAYVLRRAAAWLATEVSDFQAPTRGSSIPVCEFMGDARFLVRELAEMVTELTEAGS